MPKNLFQEIIFTLMMVAVMVYAMVVYNISLDRGGLTNEVFLMAFGELLIMGIAAFILEMFIAGPLAKKLAFCFGSGKRPFDFSDFSDFCNDCMSDVPDDEPFGDPAF